MGGWEEQIDVDDSDLPDLSTPPVLLRCSNPNQPPPPPPPALRLPIPGPAGALRDKICRKPLAAESGISGSHMHPDQVADADFGAAPWLRALRSIGSHSVPCPIGSIRHDPRARRLKEEVVGMVSSCRPNGLGDLMVMLKDPTGSIGAFVHRKVLRFSSGDITVGCVLVLKQVAVFPVRSKVYLNVTVNNVIEIINKDSESIYTAEFGQKGPAEQSDADERYKDEPTKKAAKVDDRGNRSEEMVWESVVRNKNIPSRQEVEQPSSKEHMVNVNTRAVLDDQLLQGSKLSSNHEDPFGLTPHIKERTMQVFLDVRDAEQVLDRRVPLKTSKMDRTSDDPPGRPSSLHAASRISCQQPLHENSAPSDWNHTSINRISDGPLGKMASILHTTARNEGDFGGNRVTTSHREEPSNRLPSSLHQKDGTARSFSKLRSMPGQEIGKGDKDDASEVRNQMLFHASSGGHINIQGDSNLTLKDDALPAINATKTRIQVSKTLAMEWTDEQLEELFSDYQDGNVKLGF